jgi:hypothetical protein
MLTKYFFTTLCYHFSDTACNNIFTPAVKPKTIIYEKNVFFAGMYCYWFEC